jgi:hypothetical protein
MILFCATFIGSMPFTLRPDIRPLCPIHYIAMTAADSGRADTAHFCIEHECSFQYRWNSGYLCVENDRVSYPGGAHDLLKPALIREHGYLYVASFEPATRQRIWHCPVNDCPNTIVDEAPPA